MNSQKRVGRLLSSAVVVSGAGTFLLTGAAPAFGATPQGTAVAMTPLEVIGIFVGIPVGLFVIITLLVMAPGLIRGARQQPGLSWSGRPEWFGANPDAGELAAGTGSTSSDRPAVASASASEEESGPALEGSPSTERGGAGGQW
ncbi:hypothetical protein ABN034_11505 [Actinopolymorpha sp. B11F2]|uniref:hypothetical protein n=1 Tax=Actinopolymorpha sp. B11F2 TaxID=3160862 RepID=UPI0032E4F374